MILMGQFQLKTFCDAKIKAGSLSHMTLGHQNMTPPQGSTSGQPPHGAPWVE